MINTKLKNFRIRFAMEKDVPLILKFIKELASYEKLLHEVEATEELLMDSLFKRKHAEVIIGEYENIPVSFALFFHNYSTFLGKQGMSLEDLYVTPEMRGKGIGRIMLSYLAKLASERGCERLEWSVLNWNESAIKFYTGLKAIPMDEWTVFRLAGQDLKDISNQF